MAPLPRREEERRLAALGIREQAAEIAAERPHGVDENNDDEVNYPSRPFVGNYSKGLQHDLVGDPDPASYGTLLRALESRDPQDFEEILLGPGGRKLVNPQAGLAFDLEGPDAQAVTMPPAPRFDSAETAGEMGELYWMAVLRDVHFSDYASSTAAADAAASLSTEFSDFHGPRDAGTGQVTPETLFRGVFAGDLVGPYVSQFLLKGNSDPGSPLGLGLSARDGFITYGTLKIDQRQRTAVAAVDYLKSHSDWLAVQDGDDRSGQDVFDTQRRFLRNLRDLATYVHFDALYEAYLNACLILLAEPEGDQIDGTGPGPEFPFDPGNPYNASATQVGFGTYGGPHVLSLVTEVATRALKAVWYQKWFVHRRLRPEEFGGRVDNHLFGRRGYPIDAEILDSLGTGGLAPYVLPTFGSYLLPMAFPEGSPTHPAYGAGHATVAGACVTILKAFFDEAKPIESPVVASANGLALVDYTGGDAGSMTVGGELNKLAANISLGRNGAGVHWRSDYTESLRMGEAIAVGILQEQSITYNEPGSFQLTRFDGRTIRIEDGLVDFV